MNRHFSHDRHNPDTDRPNNRNTEQWNQEHGTWQNSQNHPHDFRNGYEFEARFHESNRPPYPEYSDFDHRHQGFSRKDNDQGYNQSDYGFGGTYGASRNYGSMGSYGGAQGYGTASGGNNFGDTGSGFNSHSGRADRGNYEPVQHRVYGAYRDRNSFAPGEKERYDGSLRYGSQGADNSRRRLNRSEEEPRHENLNRSNQRFNRQEDNTRYEIYDTARSQYNRGEYGNPTRGTALGPNEGFSQRTTDQYENSDEYKYGFRPRGRNRPDDSKDRFFK